MSNRQDDRSSRMGIRNDDPRRGGGRDGGAREVGAGEGWADAARPPRGGGGPGRVFDRDQDMGGSGWSGASGRGGVAPERGIREGGYPNQGGYRGELGYGPYGPPSEYGAGSEYAHSTGYAGDEGYAHDEGGFLSEDSPGHVPGQRWSGGYGGDRDRGMYNAPPDRDALGRGFTGSDFGGRPGGYHTSSDDAGWRGDYPGRYGAAAEHAPRHFGNDVDRGGRMGYGLHGTEMGLGAPGEERGPHYGKGPKGYKRSDERTREDVCEAISHQGYIDASDVEVTFANGILTLSGTVAHRQDKRKLEHLAEQCRGVHEVHNELRLKREDPNAANTGSGADDRAGTASASGRILGTSTDRTAGATDRSDPSGSSNGNTKNGKPARA